MMKKVGLRKLKRRTKILFKAEERLLITRKGRPIGVFIPFRHANKRAAARSSDRLDATLSKIYAETGMTEDEFIAIFLDDNPHDEAWQVPDSDVVSSF